MDVVRGQLRFRGELQAKTFATTTITTTMRGMQSMPETRNCLLQLDDARVSEIAPVVFVSSRFLPRKPSA